MSAFKTELLGSRPETAATALTSLQLRADVGSAHRGVAALPGAVLLETARPGPGDRFSILAALPVAVMEVRHGESEVRGLPDVPFSGEPFSDLRRLLGIFAAERAEGVPFAGGLIGCVSYEARRLTERLPSRGLDETGHPDLRFGAYEAALVHDAGPDRWTGVAVLRRGDPVQNARAARTLRCLEEAAGRGGTARLAAPSGAPLESNFTRAAYVGAVERIRGHIFAGDVYQVNLAQRFRGRLDEDPLLVAERLRTGNPAPLMAFLPWAGGVVLAASPERFFRVDGDRIETCPIKGTAPRGLTAAEDAENARRLLASGKDLAELAMIVDVERNDVARVSVPGSVRVLDAAALESHPAVHHLAGRVEARLGSGCDAVDALAALFPGGSVTGAPKIRAMEIIDALEDVRRGPYTGAVGYFSFDGRADLAVAIRTAVLQDGGILFHAGGGVTLLSDPEAEYEETLAKAGSIARPLGLGLPR